jgi:hypothetical protein
MDTGTGLAFRAITFGNGQFVAVGSGGVIFTSPDGEKWTRRESPTKFDLNGVTYGKDQFMAVGGWYDPDTIQGIVLSSIDGVSWVQASMVPGVDLQAICFGASSFVIGGYGERSVGAVGLWSMDGVLWTPWDLKFTDPSWDPRGVNAFTYGKGLFVGIQAGYAGASPPGGVFTSSDGQGWGYGRYFSDLGAVAYGDGQFVAAGGSVRFVQGGGILHSGLIYSSPDATNWLQSYSDQNGGVMNAVAYGGGYFVVVGEANSYSSPDGIKWTRHYIGAYASGIAYGNGRFVLVAGSGTMRSGPVNRVGASLSPDGYFVGEVHGSDGQEFAIQSSADLGAWNPFTTVGITNGVGTFTEPVSTNPTPRFYRVLEIKR